MSVLVYIGANEGIALSGMISKYDKIFAFEPIPQIFDILVNKLGHHNHVEFVNAACGDKEGDTSFFLSHQSTLVSSSLGQFTSRPDLDHLPPFTKTTVKCINLFNFLQERNIDFIDSYVSDAQGADYQILLTIKDYIDNRLIRSLQLETHGNLNLYQGLENGFDKHNELLKSNYNLTRCIVGNSKQLTPEMRENELEWDSYWVLK